VMRTADGEPRTPAKIVLLFPNIHSGGKEKHVNREYSEHWGRRESEIQ